MVIYRIADWLPRVLTYSRAVTPRREAARAPSRVTSGDAVRDGRYTRRRPNHERFAKKSGTTNSNQRALGPFVFTTTRRGKRANYSNPSRLEAQPSNESWPVDSYVTNARVNLARSAAGGSLSAETIYRSTLWNNANAFALETFAAFPGCVYKIAEIHVLEGTQRKRGVFARRWVGAKGSSSLDWILVGSLGIERRMESTSDTLSVGKI